MSTTKNTQTEGETWLLATDMDGTVIPLDDRPESLASVSEFHEALGRRENLVLAYITGRHRELALEGVEQTGLPMPDYLVCDVGTSVYALQDGRWVREDAYDRLMEQALGGAALQEAVEGFAGEAGVTLQESFRQGRFKGSLYLEPGRDHPAMVNRIREALSGDGVQAEVIYSRDETSGRGLLDLLPPGVSKHTALAYLQQAVGAAFEHVVYAGDSGNDEAVFEKGWQSIAVGNTPSELKKRLEALKEHEERPVYLAEKFYAAGVVEGWRHFRG